MIDDISFNYINKFGQQKKYLIIDKFNKDNKNFIIYKEENENDIYASFYEIIDDKLKIMPIERNEDYNIVDKYLEEL